MPPPLHTAAIAGDGQAIKKLCVENSGAVDVIDTTGSTALHWAANHGHKEVVKLLLEAQASPTATNRAKLTPLDLAKKNRNSDVVTILKATSKNPSLKPSKVAKDTVEACVSQIGPKQRPSKARISLASVYSSSSENSDSEDEDLTEVAQPRRNSTGTFRSEGLGTIVDRIAAKKLQALVEGDDEGDENALKAETSGSNVDDNSDDVITSSDMATLQGTLKGGNAADLANLVRSAVFKHAQKVEDDGQLVIFLSSPFNGLRDERDIFINRYLPMLRGRCENKGIAVKVVDLRWGISSKQSAEGMTLTICLRGVRDSNLFLGFYGARYGTVYNPNAESTFWVKKDFDVALSWKNDDGSPQFGWIQKYSTRAVTELEFRAGWLNQPGERLAAFYFRDVEYDNKKADFYEQHEDPEQRAEARHYKNPFEADYTKLNRLKQECTDCAPTSTYYEPADAASMFHTQCDRWLDWVLPKGGVGAMGAEDGAHRAFASARTQMYVQDADQVGDLASTILEDTTKRVVLLVGPSGSGKSALLANLVKRFSTDKKYADHVMLTHYIGCTSESTDLGQMLRRLIYHLQLEKRKALSEEDILRIEHNLPAPECYVELTVRFLDELKRRCASLAKRNAKALFVLTIDALSQLDRIVYTDAEGRTVMAHDLKWFPPTDDLPDNLRIVVSTLPSIANPEVGLGNTPIEVLECRSDVTVKHAFPLSKNDRHQFCKVVLEKAGKNLKDNQLRRVVYGEAYMIPAKERKKDRKNTGSAQSVYYVRDAGVARVIGKYLEQKNETSDGQPVYLKHDDARYRLARKEGKWTLNEYYVCPHGTDSPPSLGWQPTNQKFGDPPQVRCLQPPTHLPLFLKLAMEELCAFGLFEELDRKIREISSCGSIPTLLLLMLDRLENGMEDKLAVRNIFSQIWCSRNGMMAAELCELAGIESEAAEEWALLFSAVRPFLVERGGRFTFLHNYIKDAVAARYCPTTGHRWAVASMQFYYFHPYMVGLKSGAPPERIVRAREELDQLERFVDAKVLREPILEAQTEELDFTGDNVGPDVAKAIGQGLMTNSRLKKLVLAGNAISDKGCAAITSAIQKNRVLVYLDLSSNGITNEGARCIASALKSNHVIAHIDISDNKIGPLGAKEIAAGIALNKSVVYFNSSCNNFQSIGAKDLAKAISDNSTMTTLRFENNSIGDKGAVDIANALHKNKVLSHVYLGMNRIHDEGCLALFTAASQTSSIVHIAINDNEMSTQGALALNDLLLQDIATLREINVEGCGLGDDGMSELSRGLRKNRTLIKLNLNNNNIGIGGARALGEALSENETLECLTLRRNNVNDEAVEFLCEVLHCADSKSMQKYLKLWKHETSYLKQWKNRNQLKARGHHHHGHKKHSRTKSPADGRVVLTDPVSEPQEPPPLPHFLSLDDLSTQLMRIERMEQNRKTVVPKMVRHCKKGDDDRVGDNAQSQHHDNGHNGKHKKVAKHGKSAIKLLDMSYNKFGAEGGKFFGEALQSNSCVETIRLEYNLLTDDGGEKIFEALKVNTTLSALYLQNCGVGDLTLKVLGEALAGADNKSLTLVNLANSDAIDDDGIVYGQPNNITDDGLSVFAALIERVKAGCALRSLTLSGNNKIRDDGAKALGFAMLENHVLSLSEVLLPDTVHPKVLSVIKQLAGINGRIPATSVGKREMAKKLSECRRQLRKKLVNKSAKSTTEKPQQPSAGPVDPNTANRATTSIAQCAALMLAHEDSRADNLNQSSDIREDAEDHVSPRRTLHARVKALRDKGKI